MPHGNPLVAMTDSISVFLFVEVKCGKNRTQYQRAKSACSESDVYFLTRRGVCDEIESTAVSVEATGEGVLARILFPLWLVLRVATLSRNHEVECVRTNHTPQTVCAGFLLSLFGHTWIADVYDSPHLGVDLQRTIKSPARFAATVYNLALLSVAKRVLRTADLIVLGIEPTVMREYGVHPGDENLLQVTNGVAVEPTRKALTSNTEGSFTLVYVGPVRKERAIDTLFDALNRVDSETSNVELCLVGQVLEEDREWIDNKRNSFDNVRVELTGKVPHEVALERIDAATVGVCPLSVSVENYRSAYPIKIFEYMALQKPTVATDTPGTREIVEDGKTGLLVPPDDAEAMADAILALHDDPSKCEEMGDNAAEAAEQYDWERINEKVTNEIKSVVSS